MLKVGLVAVERVGLKRLRAPAPEGVDGALVTQHVAERVVDGPVELDDLLTMSPSERDGNATAVDVVAPEYREQPDVLVGVRFLAVLFFFAGLLSSRPPAKNSAWASRSG